jgi:GNAT superfamily N-acetyltransferase
VGRPLSASFERKPLAQLLFCLRPARACALHERALWRANSRSGARSRATLTPSPSSRRKPRAKRGRRRAWNAFGSNALFEAWVAQERSNAPLIAHAIITKSYDVRRGAANIVLCELFVVPEQRRSGLARKMMSAVARRARDLGARELAITTGVENEVAQRFFNAVGAKRRDAAVFMMSADGIEWLAAEGN